MAARHLMGSTSVARNRHLPVTPYVELTPASVGSLIV